MYQRPAQKQGKHRTFEASFHTQLHHEHLCRTYGVLLFREQAGGTACTCGKIKPTHALLNKTYPELAFILHEGYTMNEFDVREFCQGKIARYKIPKYIFFVKEFPMTGSGKIQKFKLKDLSLKLCAEQGIEII